jgi:hypothetical protein
MTLRFAWYWRTYGLDAFANDVSQLHFDCNLILGEDEERSI